MTWQNATFVVVVAGLMWLLEWARHRFFDRWWNEDRQRIMLLYLVGSVPLFAGVAILIVALTMN